MFAPTFDFIYAEWKSSALIIQIKGHPLAFVELSF